MRKVSINDKFGKRTVWLMSTCPNYHAVINSHSRVKGNWLPAHRLIINGIEYGSVTDAAANLSLTRYTVTLRIKSNLSKWKYWVRIKV